MSGAQCKAQIFSGCYFICAFLSYDKYVQNKEVLGFLYSQSTDLKNCLKL